MDLNTSYEVPILEALSETGGFETGQVAKTFKSPFGRSNREHSSDVRAWLQVLKSNGLVDHLDQQKPVCWVRTRKGSRALKRNT